MSHQLINMKEACRLTSLSAPTVYRLRASGDFPDAVKLPGKRVAFVRDEIDAWIGARIAARSAPENA